MKTIVIFLSSLNKAWTIAVGLETSDTIDLSRRSVRGMNERHAKVTQRRGTRIVSRQRIPSLCEGLLPSLIGRDLSRAPQFYNAARGHKASQT